MERGASQQQRVLTFNDIFFFFADAAGRASDGCWLVGTSMEGSIAAPSVVVVCLFCFFFPSSLTDAVLEKWKPHSSLGYQLTHNYRPSTHNYHCSIYNYRPLYAQLPQLNIQLPPLNTQQPPLNTQLPLLCAHLPLLDTQLLAAHTTTTTVHTTTMLYAQLPPHYAELPQAQLLAFPWQQRLSCLSPASRCSSVRLFLSRRCALCSKCQEIGSVAAKQSHTVCGNVGKVRLCVQQPLTRERR